MKFIKNVLWASKVKKTKKSPKSKGFQKDCRVGGFEAQNDEKAFGVNFKIFGFFDTPPHVHLSGGRSGDEGGEPPGKSEIAHMVHTEFHTIRSVTQTPQ